MLEKRVAIIVVNGDKLHTIQQVARLMEPHAWQTWSQDIQAAQILYPVSSYHFQAFCSFL